MVSDLATAIDLHDRDVARREHVLGAPGLALGVDRVVLDQPQFVGAVRAAHVGVGLHRAPHGHIRLPAQHAHVHGVAGGQSVHFTEGCARRRA